MCSVRIGQWLFPCRRSKKLIHQKKWSFGSSREGTEAIRVSGFQFLYSVLEKVWFGLSQIDLFPEIFIYPALMHNRVPSQAQ